MRTAHARTGRAPATGSRGRASRARAAPARTKTPHKVSPHEWEIGTYRFVIRAVLWVIYLAVVLALIVWWVRT